MAEEKEVLIVIDIDTDNAIRDMAETRKGINALKKDIKELEKAEGDNTEEIEKMRLQLKLEQEQLRKTERETKNVIKANKEAKGSINALRAELALVTTKWNALSKEERENTEVGKALSEQKKDLTDKLKAEERATGDARRNVGNYSEVIQGLAPGMANAAAGFKQMTLAALKFIATPIGAVLAAIVAVFKLLQASFNRSLSSQEKLNKITGKLSAAFGVLLDILVPVVEFILDQVLTAFEEMGKAVIFIIEKLEKWGIISEQTADKVKGALDKSTEAADRLADAERRLVKADIALQKTQLKFQTQAEKLRQIRDDESKSIKERIKANEDLGKLLVKQLETEKRLAQQALQVALDRQTVNGESIQSIQEIGAAEIKLAEIKERITSQESEQLANLNSLRRDEAALIKEEEDKKQKALDEAEKDRLKKQAEADVAILKQRLETQREYEDATAQLAISRQETELENNEKHIFALLDQERSGLEAKHQQEVELYEKLGANTAEIEKKYAAARLEINKAETEAKLSLAGDFVGNIAKIAGEGSAIGKAAAVAQTTISTYQAATGAYASLAAIPVVGPVLGAAAATAALALGFANVRKILSVDSGLPGDGGVSASGVSGGGSSAATPSRASGLTPTLNQGIVSRATNINTKDEISVQPTLVVDQVTVNQSRELSNKETAVL